MAEDLHPLLRAGLSPEYLSPDVVNLVRFMVGEKGNASVEISRDLDYGVLGNFNSTTNKTKLRPMRDSEVMLETLAHELSHATSSRRNADERARAKDEPYYPLGSIGSKYLNEFFRDMFPEMSKQDQYDYDKRLTDRAKELGLPSSSTRNFSEVEANAVAARTMNELKLPTDDSAQVDKFMAEFPEFQDWVNQDLAGKYRNSPRMTQWTKPQSLTDQILALIR